MEQFDTIIIGSGPAGGEVARGLAAAGRQVAVAEAHLWGGTCPNVGCDPTKIMMSAVETKVHAKAMQEAGISGSLEIDWATLQKRKRAYTDGISSGTKTSLETNHVTTLVGEAAFNSDGTLLIGEKTYQADSYVIATGQRPRLPGLVGESYLLTSDDFLSLEQLPKKLVFLGGGPVSLELAQIAQASGSEVTLVIHGKRKINGFDEELAEAFLEQLEKQGIRIITNRDVTEIQKTKSGYLLKADNDWILETGAVFAGVGRTPNVESLNLSAVGVKTSKQGIIVDGFLKTTTPTIYAVGDVIAKNVGKLTPVAGFEARYLVDVLTGKAKETIRYPLIPSVIYGATKMAQVGRLESSHVQSFDMTSWYSYRRLAEPKALAKIAFNEKEEMVGASIVSSLADEMINFLTPLIAKKITKEEVKKQILAYPTPASDLVYLYD
ncbi:MAG: NAD(P)/FAD-dependent oxidoreductase [Streptococcaceae bacterium]|nr:NAD(P)/FAD-dependent oxidoreductase [Streptococcaceae bacterium]